MTRQSGKGVLQMGETTLYFGSSCQDVLSLFGHPSHKFLKESSKMQVGGPVSEGDSEYLDGLKV